MEQQMDIFQMLDVVEANLPQIRKNLGNDWPAFKEGLILISEKLEGKSPDYQVEKATTDLRDLLFKYGYARGFFHGTSYGIRTRGAASAAQQLPKEIPESLVSQRMSYPPLPQFLRQVLKKIEETEHELDPESHHESIE